MFSKLAFFAAFAALNNLSQAHMTMKDPPPFGNPNNSPLEASGSDFPCKGGSSAGANVTHMSAGAPQLLDFKGSAVHGGGSCQVSLTTDTQPNKNSKFKVIHSIIGGCPASAAGNLGNDPNGSGASKFGFIVPKDSVPNGDYALAWTWFNKVGNREMYMNCASVTVADGQGTPDSFNKLPDMFIGNIGNYEKVPESTDYKFKNPGNTDNIPPPETGSPSSAGSGSAGGSGQSGGSSGGAGAPGAGAGAGSGAGTGAQASHASPQGPAATPAQGGSQGAATPVASPASGGSSSGSSGSSAASSGGGKCAANAVPCQNPGAMVCLPNNQFGICDQTNCAIPQPLAAGTHCANGSISKRGETRYNSPILRARHQHGIGHAHRT